MSQRPRFWHYATDYEGVVLARRLGYGNFPARGASQLVRARGAHLHLCGREGLMMMDPRRKLRDETGSDAAGQSGDIEGMDDGAYADSESAEELLEEGNAFEAGIVAGVEDSLDPDQGEVRTRQFPEDDVPEEYLDDDR